VRTNVEKGSVLRVAAKPGYIFLAGFAASFALLQLGELIGYSKLTASWNHKDYIMAVRFIAGAISWFAIMAYFEYRFPRKNRA
jgi:hypothetical protein